MATMANKIDGKPCRNKVVYLVLVVLVVLFLGGHIYISFSRTQDTSGHAVQYSRRLYTGTQPINSTNLSRNRTKTTPYIYDSVNTSASKDSDFCETEVHHVAFVKVHKAGSSTVMNILQRFAYKRDLILALPQTLNIFYDGIKNLMPELKNSTVDMLINHVDHYDRKVFESILPQDTRYLGVVREPLMQALSAFSYFVKMFSYIPGDNKLQAYFNNREKYEFKDASRSYTNNRMSYEFGLEQMHFHDAKEISKFLTRLDSEMDLILIIERLPESLILLKRLFCWQIKDVIYVTKNMNGRDHHINITSSEREYHRNFSFADYMLYDYFNARLDDMIRAQTNDFQQEVHQFKTVLAKVEEHCQKLQNKQFTATSSTLKFSETKFHKAFEIDTDDCRLIMIAELQFLELYREKQEKILSRRTASNHLT